MLSKILGKKTKGGYSVKKRPEDLPVETPIPHFVLDIPKPIAEALAEHDANIQAISEKARIALVEQQTAKKQLMRSVILTEESLDESKIAYEKSPKFDKIYIWDKEKVMKDRERKAAREKAKVEKAKSTTTTKKTPTAKKTAASKSAKPAAKTAAK